MMKIMNSNHNKTLACQETEARQEEMRASRKETAAVIEPETEVKTMACREMEAHQEEEEPTSADRILEAAERREVPVDDTEVIPIGEPRKKRPRKLAAERRRQELKDTKKTNGASQEKLAVARRGTTHRAKVAWKTPTDRKMSRRATVA
jgi:hypothetical protein